MELPDGLVSSYVNVNGIKTHYVHGGTGEPLILVHGAGPGASGWSGWRQTIPVLARHYHVIALDTLGFGMTDKPTDIVYSDQASVNHLAGFIDALCLDKVLLCGNSRGAYMATKYLLDYPSRVRRLLLVSSGSLAAAMGIERNEKQKGGIRTLSAFDGSNEAMRRWMEVIVNDHSKITDELITERVRIASLPGHDYVLKSAKQYRDGLKSNPNEQQLFDVSHRLPLVDLPMLMVWGGKDNFAPPEFVPQLTEKLPNIKFIMLENSGHQAQNDESDRFNQIAMDFFADKP